MEQPISILIVDDEPKNLTVLQSVLDDPRYRLVRAESAEEALLALVAEEFALLILDIRMPGMTGFELAQMIKERKKTAQVPIIFLSAYYSEDQHVLEGYSTGAVDYLHKPVNPVILRSKVAVFAELHRKSREVEQANRALLTEVTERRRAEEQLLELNETLEQRVAERTEALSEMDRRKEEFLAMLGHELRNPLNAIRQAVQIAHEKHEDEEACHWAANVIDRQSQQLSRMVDDLLDVARINRGRIELRPETLEVGALLERALAVVRPLVEQRRHTLTKEIDSPLPVTGDAARLEQVFVNLLNNAAKYTPEGGSISVCAHLEDGEVVTAITDNGEGISAELLPHVFDIFRQADSTLNHALGGLGIGLSVVKSLVEMHRGHVRLESSGANAGTTVTVRLPLLIEKNLPPPASDSPIPGGSMTKSVRVLIVDDHEDAALTLALLLQLRGCEVRCAHTGPDGVALARAFHPEVLVLDLGLPGFDGYELARILRAEAPFSSALFIAISGYAQACDRARCLAVGFDDHFAKPLEFPKLMEAIQSRSAAPLARSRMPTTAESKSGSASV